MRAFFPLILFLLRDRLGASSVQVGAFALLVFSLSFLGGLFTLTGRYQRALGISFAGMLAFRWLGQLWWGDPLLELGLNVAVLAFFFSALPAVFRLPYDQANPAVTGVPVGLLLDAALHGALGSYDLFWRQSLWSVVVLGLLCVVSAIAWRGALPLERPRTLHVCSLAAVGPFFFLQLQIFGNLARLTALSGWPPAGAYACQLLVQMVALWGALWFSCLADGVQRLGVASGAGLLLVALVAVPWPTGWHAAGVQILGQTAAVGLLVGMLTRQKPPPRAISGAFLYWCGMVGLVVLTFSYYASYDLPLPFQPVWLAPVAALAVWSLCLVTLWFDSSGPRERPPGRIAAGLTPLLLLPLFFLEGRPVEHPTEAGKPFTVLTYNLHNGFDVEGHLGLEPIAREIEMSGADVVALQEVSRGWVVYGSVDMMAWLSRRLGMRYVYGPTADPLWGNALLSRFPLNEVELAPLPPPDLRLRRGFIRARVDLETAPPINIVATHFHYKVVESSVRIEQARTLLGSVEGVPRTLLLGDFNAQPQSPEIELILRAGFGSATPSGTLTFPSSAPTQQLDYVWHSPDLVPFEARVLDSTASDHLGVTARFELGRSKNRR